MTDRHDIPDPIRPRFTLTDLLLVMICFTVMAAAVYYAWGLFEREMDIERNLFGLLFIILVMPMLAAIAISVAVRLFGTRKKRPAKPKQWDDD